MSKDHKVSPHRRPGRLRLIVVMRYIAYFMLFLLLYVVQSTPGLLTVFGAKPNLLLCAAVCLAMFEGEFVGGLYGALAGILLDLSSDGYFGFYALLLCIFCTVVGLMVIYLLRLTVGNALWLVLGVTAICELLRYYFYYHIWGYAGSWHILTEDLLPGCIYTLLVTPLLFWGIRWFVRRLRSADPD